MRKFLGVLGVVVLVSQSPVHAANCSPQILDLIGLIAPLEDAANQSAQNSRKWLEIRQQHRQSVERILISVEGITNLSPDDRALILCRSFTRGQLDTAKSTERWAQTTADTMQGHLDTLRTIRKSLQEACEMEQAAVR